MTRLEFVRARLAAPPPPLVRALPIALAFVAAPTLLRLAVDTMVTATVFTSYFPFVLVSALLFGSRVAILATLGSALLANYLFMEPRHVLFARPGDALGALLFLVSSTLLIGVVSALRRTFAQLQAGMDREAELNSRLSHMNSELQHRVMNMLTVVQGLATQTFRANPTNSDVVRLFNGRLHALAEAQSVLTSGQWQYCQLPDLALRALAPFNGEGTVEITGPTCALPETSCVPLVLALHELGTNAIKYGALSTLGGSVKLVWSVQDDGGTERKVVMEWAESDGPEVRAPTRRGLGSRLLRSQPGLEEVAQDFHPEGLTCRIRINLAR